MKGLFTEMENAIRAEDLDAVGEKMGLLAEKLDELRGMLI